MSAPLAVVAVGARTPVGLRAESSAAAVRAGICRYLEQPFISAKGGLLVVARDAKLDSWLPICDRMLALAGSAAEEVLAKLPTQASRLVGLVVLPEPRPGFSEEAAQVVLCGVQARLQQLARVPVEVRAAGHGHAGGVAALQQAGQLVQAMSNSREGPGLVLVLGVDSFHAPATYTWLLRNRRFAQAEQVGGFTPGEGAGALLLASLGDCQRWRLPILAQLSGCGLAVESRLLGCDSGSLGGALTQAVQAAVAGLSLPGDSVDALYVDLNGERYRSEEWGFVALRTPTVWKSLSYAAPSRNWGDVGAASAVLGTMLAVQALVRGYARGPRSLVMAGSDGGLRGALLVQGTSSVAVGASAAVPV